MPYTLGQAAKATGKSKPTILRSIRLGRISAVKDPLGTWQIEPVELHRVYPPLSPAEHQQPEGAERHEPPSNGNLLEELRGRLAEKDRLVEDLRSERDRWREESDSWRQQAQSLLTDQTPRPTRRGWWPFRRS
jgi:hypothetical protein